MNSKKLKLFFVDNMIWVILLGVFLFFGIIKPRTFLTFQNVHFILYVSSMMGFLVFAETICLLSGNFDLSIGEIAGFSAMVTAVITVKSGLPGYLGIILVVLIGGLCGAFNGLLVGKIRLNPFLVTLGTSIMFDWLTMVVRRGSVLGLPAVYLAPGGARVFGVYLAIFILLGFAILLAFVLAKTIWGSNLYSVGGNIEATRRCGINTDKVVFSAFVVAGMLAGISGLLYTGYMGVATSNLADGTVFMAFAGAVIGGVSLTGGRGSILNALGGTLLLGIIEAGLTMMAIDPAWQGTFTGVLVLVAILLNQSRQILRDRILMGEM
ncbi:ABC transporter permease [Candidatus Sordicultor fermentans]|jgi:ribose/xylose/arabinose/galactoside ABC-type transport system permease subunit|uniref:ABC transporter permease n=1 Tax=Candidatus Sordicultor fermentans TaxID=1953203 RepID=UPI0016B4EE0C|nr:ABC transporter permease [Atribacterota bacterium]NLY06523.1 ABC transporter permease [Candidatus Atribacteria bacterium]